MSDNVEGWRRDTQSTWLDGETGKGSTGFEKGDTTVYFDGEYLEMQQDVSGYGGYNARVALPVEVLKSLLAHLGLEIVKREAPTSR